MEYIKFKINPFGACMFSIFPLLFTVWSSHERGVSISFYPVSLPSQLRIFRTFASLEYRNMNFNSDGLFFSFRKSNSVLPSVLWTSCFLSYVSGKSLVRESCQGIPLIINAALPCGQLPRHRKGDAAETSNKPNSAQNPSAA